VKLGDELGGLVEPAGEFGGGGVSRTHRRPRGTSGTRVLLPVKASRALS
jgi:hypothetical protein